MNHLERILNGLPFEKGWVKNVDDALETVFYLDCPTSLNHVMSLIDEAHFAEYDRKDISNYIKDRLQVLPFCKNVNDWFGFDRDNDHAVYYHLTNTDYDFPIFCPNKFAFISVLERVIVDYRPCTLEQVEKYVTLPENIKLESWITSAILYSVICENGGTFSLTRAYQNHIENERTGS